MPLLLDLLRHGAAEASHSSGDAERGLTASGREQLQRLGEQLGRTGWRPERALSSPFRRARQSAEVVLAAAGHQARVETLVELVPEAEPDDVLAALEALGLSNDHVLLVTHQPLIGLLTKRLTGQEISFPPGGLTRVSLPDGPRGPGVVLDS